MFDHEPHFDNHRLLLSFQDTLGNDLVKDMVSIGGVVDSTTYNTITVYTVNPEVYKLNVYFPNGITSATRSPTMGLNKNINYQLEFDVASDKKKHGSSDRKITFSLKCPYLFDDDSFHDIVTWWHIGFGNMHNTDATCYRIEYGGKEYTEIYYVNAFPYNSIATIILDR